jgi:hypothetical protein
VTDTKSTQTRQKRPPKGLVGASGHSRRRLAVLAGVMLALIVLVVIPGFLAAQPGFFSRYPGLSKQYAPWAVSTHAETGCEECHVRPRLLDRAAYRVRMVGEFYVSLVSRSRVPGVFATPTARRRPEDPAPRTRDDPQDAMRPVPRLPGPREEPGRQAHPAHGRMSDMPRRRQGQERVLGVSYREGRACEPQGG